METDGEVDRWDSARVWAASGFLAFLDAHGINRQDLLPPEGSLVPPRRYFRLKQAPLAGARDAQTEGREALTSNRCTASQVLASVQQDLRREGVADASPEPVPWLEGFYSLPAAAPLARLGAYQRGDVYGVDISSGYCVSLLGIRPGDHVLDLCCAPGAKLSMAADLLGLRGSLTGVDCSRQRIGACKRIAHKYQLVPAAAPSTAATVDSDATASDMDWRCRLFCADGRVFRVGPCDESLGADGVELVLDTREIAARGPHGQLRKRKNKSARGRERKRQRLAAVEGADAEPSEPGGAGQSYDKVLVDAECTHDGSVRHLQRLKTLDEWRAYVAEHLSERQLERILELQRDLIRNGFRLLRPGGTMIYSTCSLSVKQNEGVVESFLREEAAASLEPIDRAGIPCQEGRLPGTVRFTPSNNTSGLFIAKIRRGLGSRTERKLTVSPSL